MTETETAPALEHGAEAELYLGRTTGGEHVYAFVRLEAGNPARTVETVTHTRIPAPDHLSITWAVARKGAPVRGGAARVADIPDGWMGSFGAGAIDYADGRPVRTDARRLAELGERWHLNDMHAACVHMPADAGRRYRDGETVTCPETGYRYGHAWLAEVIPADVLAEVAGIVARAAVAR